MIVPSIFRQAFLEHNRDTSQGQQDKALQITSPMSWIALAGIALALVVVVIWSFTGSLTSTTTAPGYMVSSSTGTNTITSSHSGQVMSILVEPGTRVRKNDLILTLQAHTGGSQSSDGVSVYSDQDGYVQQILVGINQNVSNGTDLVRISPVMSMGQQEVVVAYVPENEVGNIRLGQEVLVTLNAAGSSIYGHMTGRVINIDNRATTIAGIESVVGSDNGLSGQLQEQGAVRAVTCELWPDQSGGEKNSYMWSNPRGRSWTVTANAACTVYIITAQEAPISRVFGGLLRLMGSR